MQLGTSGCVVDSGAGGHQYRINAIIATPRTSAGIGHQIPPSHNSWPTNDNKTMRSRALSLSTPRFA
jgi:hypothetical protein